MSNSPTTGMVTESEIINKIKKEKIASKDEEQNAYVYSLHVYGKTLVHPSYWTRPLHNVNVYKKLNIT